MQFSKIFKGLSLATLASTAVAFNAGSKDNVAVYWGQASAGSQEDLSYYCDSDDVDIVIISFLSSFPGTNGVPTLDLSSACSDKYSNGLLKCPDVGSDIKSCQAKGKKVLLSLGGAAGSYGFSGDSEGEEFADTLWNLFGEGDSDTRPFGDASVDGFDFDIENKDQKGYVALSKKLRQRFDSGSKDYYLAAAPQCVYPDESVGEVLESVDIDFAFIQFYNNYCSLDKQFNWDTWSKFAQNTSPNKNIKLYLGLPGASSAAGSGYVDISTIKQTLSSIGSDSNFGGIMLWDASQSFTNKVNGDTFAGAVKDALSSLGGGSSNTGSSTQASSTTQASTTAGSSTAAQSSVQAPVSSVNNGQYQQSSAQTTTSSVNNGQYQQSQAPTSSVNNGQYQQSQTTVASANNSQNQASASAGQFVPKSLVQAKNQADPSEPSTPSSNTLSYEEVTSNTFSAFPSSFSSVLVSSQSQQASTPASASGSASSAGPASGSASTPGLASDSASTPASASDSFSTPASASSADPASDSASTPASASDSISTPASASDSASTPTSASDVASSAAPSGGNTPSVTPGECSSLTGLSKAQCLNKNYKAGQYDGKPTECDHGSTACSPNGEYSVCNWGQWVSSACAAGTTCFAYPQSDDTVFVGCNYQSDEAQYSKRHVHHDHI